MNVASNERIESNVRYYSRHYPVVFRSAEGATLVDEHDRTFVDFFCGAGALNYGHNHPALKTALLDYLARNGIVHSLDLHTEAKFHFLEQFESVILRPRGLDYKVQFTGPTGTNAVEAALKLARKVKGRSTIAAFTGAFHGVSLGSLAATAQRTTRAAAGVQLDQVLRLPFDGFLSGHEIAYIERLLTAPESGVGRPAAFLIEVVQGEGGLNQASAAFLERLFDLAREIDALVIVDDIQAGCGRTGSFFSFEDVRLVPDIVCLSKSLSGYGLPMSVVLMKPEYDEWKSGEHNGTFRGNNLAFVTAAAAIDFWRQPSFGATVDANVRHLQSGLRDMCGRFPFAHACPKGRGLFAGIELHDGDLAARVTQECFEQGLMIERCGPTGSVLKLLPPINIDRRVLDNGLAILEEALQCVLTKGPWVAAPVS